MIRTDKIVKLVKESKDPLTFDEIWNAVGKEIMEELGETDEIVTKTDLYLAIMDDPKIIQVGENTWDLRSNYSFEKAQEIVRTRMTEELELEINSVEKSEDTIEMEIGLPEKSED